MRLRSTCKNCHQPIETGDSTEYWFHVPVGENDWEWYEECRLETRAEPDDETQIIEE